MDLDTFIGQLRELLSADLPEHVNPYDGLYDELEFDSFQAFELLIVVESLAGTLVPPEEVPEIFTLADAYEYYEALRAAEASAEAAVDAAGPGPPGPGASPGVRAGERTA